MAQQNRVTPSPFHFGLKTLDLDCDKNIDHYVLIDKATLPTGLDILICNDFLLDWSVAHGNWADLE